LCRGAHCAPLHGLARHHSASCVDPTSKQSRPTGSSNNCSRNMYRRWRAWGGAFHVRPSPAHPYSRRTVARVGTETLSQRTSSGGRRRAGRQHRLQVLGAPPQDPPLPDVRGHHILTAARGCLRGFEFRRTCTFVGPFFRSLSRVLPRCRSRCVQSAHM
jgi:hypothetical protein